MTLVDDTAAGWTLEKFENSPNPEETFRQVFGTGCGDDAAFDYVTSRDFLKTLERV